ncbi:MAG: TetR/AcrR family transcriptional regulator [Acidimicrobiia bacterium]
MTDEIENECDPRIERTRRLVLGATADLVAERGYDKTTIEGVSDRCGVARSTIYRHWPDKQHLIVEAVKSRLVLDPDIDTGSVQGDIECFLGQLVEWFSNDDVVTIALSMLSAAHRNAAMSRLHFEATKARRNHLVQLIERGKSRGELPADIDASDSVAELAGAIFYKRVVLGEPIPPDYVRQHTERWLRQVGWVPVSTAG